MADIFLGAGDQKDYLHFLIILSLFYFILYIYILGEKWEWVHIFDLVCCIHPRKVLSIVHKKEKKKRILPADSVYFKGSI